MIDVAVVGGGPAGLLSALHLAQAGLDVAVFEEHVSVGAPTHCTGIVSAEAAELAKMPESIVLNRLTHARLVSPSGHEVLHQWPAGRGDEILVIDRAGFDAGLAEQAAAAGVELRTGAHVDRLDVGAGGVRLTIAGEPVAARACVLACGVSYRFQRQLGLGLPGAVIHTAQVEVDAEPRDVVEVRLGQAIAPGGFLWTVPVLRQGAPRLKVGVMARGDAGRHLRDFLARPDVRTTLRAEPRAPVRRLLPLRPLPKTYADRVLVVGDAGGFTKPTTGGGIFYSLLTAALAAETLAEAFGAGRLDEDFLARYERRWQQRLGAELRVADWLRGTVVKARDAELDRVVRALGAPDVQAVVRRTVRFNWHRGVILALVRQPGIAALLFRSLFR